MSSDPVLTDARTTNIIIQCENQMRLVEHHKWRCCLNCNNLNGTVCKKFGLSIPPQIAVFGCGDWDDLPF